MINGSLLLEESEVLDWALDGVDVPSGAALCVGVGVGASVTVGAGVVVVGLVVVGFGVVVGFTVGFFVVGVGVEDPEPASSSLSPEPELGAVVGLAVVGLGVLVGLAVVGSGVGVAPDPDPLEDEEALPQ